MTGRQAKEAVVPGTISGALDLGRQVLAARDEGRDPVQAVAAALGGVLLFAGKVASLAEEEKMGFYFTVATLAGTGEWTDQAARLVIKNETMLLTVNDQVKAIFPDLVCLLEPDTGRGVMSVEVRVGTPLALVGLPCHPRLRQAARSEVGARAFSPARYGHPELTYQPIESLVEAMG
jgi:DUF917 family protein